MSSSQLAIGRGQRRHHENDASCSRGNRDRRERRRWILGVLLGLLLLSSLPASPTIASEDPTIVGINDRSSTLRFESPLTDGEFVVWTERGMSPSSPYMRVLAAPLTGGEAARLGSTGSRGTVAIDEGYVAAAAAADQCGNEGTDGFISVLCLTDLDSGDQRVLANNLITPYESVIHAVAIDYPNVAWAIVDESEEAPQLTVSAMNVEVDAPPTVLTIEQIQDGSNIFLYVEGSDGEDGPPYTGPASIWK